MTRIKTIWAKYFPLLRFLIVSLTFIVLFSYFILFTPIGNRILKPFVEYTLTEALNSPITVDRFEFDHDSLLLRFHDNAQNTCTIGTSFSLLTFHGNGYYQIELTYPLAGINRFNTPFKLIGSLSGGYDSLSLLGSLQLHEGAVPYNLHFLDFSLESLNLYLNNVDYAALVALFEIPADTQTKVNGHILLKGFNNRSIKGSIMLNSQTDHFVPVQIDEDDNSSFDIAEFLADESGYIKKFDVNITADITLSESGILDPILGIRTKGPIHAHARLSGNHLKTQLLLSTTLAKSISKVQIDFVHLVPHAVHYDIAHAELDQLFLYFNLTPPLLGTLSSKGSLNTKNGSFTLQIINGKTVPKVLKQEYAITQPSLTFKSDLIAKITPGSVHYRGNFQSDLERLDIDTESTPPVMFQDLLKILP